MAWDCAFNIQWAQRIEKEERAFLAGAERAKTDGESPGGERSRRSRRGSRASSVSGGSQPGSPVLSAAGGMNLRSPSRSSRGSRSSLGRASSEASIPGIPEHLKAVSRFPVVDKDLLTARVRADPTGKKPIITFRPEEMKALWWPMRGTYTKYHPEFKFQDPPAWTPDDILKER